MFEIKKNMPCVRDLVCSSKNHLEKSKLLPLGTRTSIYRLKHYICYYLLVRLVFSSNRRSDLTRAAVVLAATAKEASSISTAKTNTKSTERAKKTEKGIKWVTSTAAGGTALWWFGPLYASA